MLVLLCLLPPASVPSFCSVSVSFYKLCSFPHWISVLVLLLLWGPGYKLVLQSLDASAALWSTCGTCQKTSFVTHSHSCRLCSAAESQSWFLFLWGYAPFVICLNWNPLAAPQETPALIWGSARALLSFNFLCKVWQGAWAHPLRTPELGHLEQIDWDQLCIRSWLLLRDTSLDTSPQWLFLSHPFWVSASH